MFTKLAVDIANYTRGIDPLPLHDAGVQLVILKADDQFQRNGTALANSGMPIAAYHWIDPTKNPQRQVADTWNLLRQSDLPTLAIFLDFEQWWSRWWQWYKAIRNKLAWGRVKQFRSRELSDHARQVFEGFASTGWKTFGYTQASFVRKYAPHATSWIGRYRWWLAHYISCGEQILTWEDLKARILPDVDFFPARPPGLAREQVVGHQITKERLSLPGLYEDAYRTKYAPANINLFDGDFLEEIGAVPQPKPLPDVLHEAIVTASPSLNIREGPGTSYPILYRLVQGTPVRITELSQGWARLRSYGEEWCSAAYLQIETETPPEVPEPPEEPETPEPGGEPEPPEPVEEPETPEPVTFDLPGVTYHRTRRYNADCHILLIDLSGKRFHVTRYTGLKPVSYVAMKLNADIVVNGDGWGTVGYPNSIAVSDGKVYQSRQFDFRPWINISKDNQVTFDSNWRKWKRKLYNTVSGDRYIIRLDGEYEHRITDFRKEPRTAIGLTRDGRLILIVADGRTEESQGLTFRELGYLFEEYGTQTAINLDGGGSSALWIKDRIVNVPIEEGVPGQERAVANHLCVFIT